MPTTKKMNGPSLLLDLGEVLIPLNFQRLFAAFGLFKDQTGSASVESMARWDLYDQFERGSLTEDEFRLALGLALGIEVEADRFRLEWNSIFDGHIPGISEFLAHASLKLPVYALSNTNPSHMAEVRRLYPWISCFREVFTSYELKARKPEADIFHRAMERMGAKPQDVVFVDDRRENVESARALGMHAYVAARSSETLRTILSKHLTS